MIQIVALDKNCYVYTKILFSEDKCHYQSELSKQLNCSAQTIMRLANEIE